MSTPRKVRRQLDACNELIAELRREIEELRAQRDEARQADRRLVERWVESARLLDERFKAADAAIGINPDSPLMEAAWQAFGAYTDLLAETIGDSDKWLEWFAWDCDFGRTPKEMAFADGETLMVVGASDLLAAIQNDDKGCRKWPLPHDHSAGTGGR